MIYIIYIFKFYVHEPCITCKFIVNKEKDIEVDKSIDDFKNKLKFIFYLPHYTG